MTLALLAVLPGFAWSADFAVDSAQWDPSRNRLTISGSGANGETVTMVNAYATNQTLGTSSVRRGAWRVRTSQPNPVPCHVLATQSDGIEIESAVVNAPADCAPKTSGGNPNQPPTADAGPDQVRTLAFGQATIAVTLDGNASSDPDGIISLYTWSGNPDPADVAGPTVNLAAGTHTFSLFVTDDDGASSSPDSVMITVNPAVACLETANPDLSINSTSQDGCPDTSVGEQPRVPNTSYSVLAVNDLGMHCGDLDTRIASILPPFQVLLAQVVRKDGTPTLNPADVTVFYSAVSNPNDPILDSTVFDGVMADGNTYKTNFWDGVNKGTYDPFYPGGLGITPLGSGALPVTPDVGLPVPNVEDLYIGADGVVDQHCDELGATCDGTLTAVQHAMPGIAAPYSANDPKEAEEHYSDKPFFVNFPFGYVAADVNWYEGAGVPLAAFDDNGRENPYPLVRVQAKDAAGTILSTVDTVLPISGEASCTGCHATDADYTSVHGEPNRTDIPTNALSAAGLPVATSLDDPDGNMPPKVSLEYAADINVLRLHDLKHGPAYVAPSPADDGTTVDAACDITANAGLGDENCLTHKALVQDKPVVCQVCHYTPALDLAHVGPMTGPEGSMANGRNQLSHKSNSNVMHNHHGSIADLDRDGNAMFPTIARAQQEADGSITNQEARLEAMQNSCYQCHPGKHTQCLRGAMFNGGMLCSDCHGDMQQVGNDFSNNVSPQRPGAFVLDQGNFYDPSSSQPRTPWANEPSCGSCHTGDAVGNLAGSAGTLVNTVDTNGNPDGIRLRQAFKTDDAKATPIVPSNKRFAEPVVPASFNGFANPGAGNPQLYRVSTGHGGVMCEGCHGATHAEWPNANPNSNDNVTAKQLQGHTGTISDCATCHVTSELPSNTQGGPHGMHLIDDVRFWREAHKDAAKAQNGRPGGGTCGACHGSDHLGTVLSRATEDRSFNVESQARIVKAGEPVGCGLCHSVSKSFGR